MDLNQPLISVIVPVYNVSQYLHRCVVSILEQTYRNIEVLLIDDGSTDNSSVLCDKLSQDHRVRVFHQANQGLSGARNTGIEHASGEYLAFVDSDDYIAPTFLSSLYSALTGNNAKLAICSIQKVDETGNYLDNCPSLSDVVLNTEQATHVLADNSIDSWILVPAWNKLYKKELFDDIRFPAGKLHEDEFIIYEILTQSSQIVCLSKKLYYYTQRDGSIMSSSSAISRLDGIEARCHQFTFCKSHHLYSCLSGIKDLTKSQYYLLFLAKKEAKNQDQLARVRQVKSMANEIGAKPSFLKLIKDFLYVKLVKH